MDLVARYPARKTFRQSFNHSWVRKGTILARNHQREDVLTCVYRLSKHINTEVGILIT